jgi:membrane-bound lytic murein transglycosylase D
MPRQRWLLLSILPCVFFGVSCGASRRGGSVPTSAAGPQTSGPLAAPSELAQIPQAAFQDPVLTLIEVSARHFSTGEQELELGNTDAAWRNFADAVRVVLESPYGSRTEPRVRDHFDRLTDRISAHGMQVGEGFTDTSEPASIDQLLAFSAAFTPLPAPPELKRTVESDLRRSLHDIPIPLNQKVLSYIDLFQGRLHDFIQEGMTRGAKYLPMIQNVLRAEGLPLDLAYVPLIESAFKPNALSRAKAKGVWQFMSGTGRENGLRLDWYIDERSDPEKATVAAAKYLSTLAEMFDGDWHLALASYNGGPGRVQRAVNKVRHSDFWKLAAAKTRYLPRETREYVPMILAAIVVAKNPQQYGFELEADDSFEYDTVTLPVPVDLRRVAEWSGTNVGEIQQLNPELRRWTTPVGDTAYELKVPAGSADIVLARLAESAPADLATLNYHTVKRGETLATIARKLEVNRTDLAEANYLKATARLSVGQQLMVPRETTAVLAGKRDDRPVPAGETPAAARDTVVPAVMPGPGNTELVRSYYRVKSGDTLEALARTFNTTVAAIKRWNNIPETTIRTGERLTIYTARAN